VSALLHLNPISIRPDESGQTKTHTRFNAGLLFGWIFILLMILPGSKLSAETETERLSLRRITELALTANIDIKSSRMETKAAGAAKNAARTFFFPTLNATYQYQRNEEEVSSPLFGIITPEEQYTFVASITQPIFNGFSIRNRFDLAALGFDIAQANEELTRQNIRLEAVKVYFNLLKAEKLLRISRETVTQIRTQKDVVNNFYQVGMSPLNDLLQAEVELANAKQAVISARNRLESAQSALNVLLRRPVGSPVRLVDILDYRPLIFDLEHCLETARKNRVEFTLAELEITLAQQEIELNRKDYFPAISVTGSYYRFGDDWRVDGGEAFEDEDTWDIQATASWDFWTWGRPGYNVREKKARLSQAILQKARIEDVIRADVKDAYLQTRAAEQLIQTVETAIEQAEENFRINQERYKEQVATSTDVLIAQTLLSRTMTHYYNALYDFKIAKATLFRTMGQEVPLE